MTEKSDRQRKGDAETPEDQVEPKGHPTGEKQAQINREDDPPA
jgi:hypothetical protein